MGGFYFRAILRIELMKRLSGLLTDLSNFKTEGREV
jgi:hypothetical protein